MTRHSGIRNLRQDQVNAIIRSFHEGLTSGQVSEIQGVSIRCVQRIWKKYKDTGSVKSKTSRSSENDVSSCRQEHCSARKERSASHCSRDSARNIDARRTELIFERRRLREAGLFGRHPAKKPLISAKNRKARLGWAQAHKSWTVRLWRKRGESKLSLFETDEIKFVRRPVGTRYHPSYQLPTVKGGGGSVMVHGSFCGKGVGPLHLIEGKMDAKMCLNIMETAIWPFVRSIARSGFIFQQVNDPKH
nr:Transposase domain containing protein [Haemonchus contortus]